MTDNPPETEVEPDQYGLRPADFDDPSDVNRCVFCGGWTTTYLIHPDSEMPAEGSPAKVVCNRCWLGNCNCEVEHTAECYVCGAKHLRAEEWYRTPEDTFGEWVCPNCGRKRERALELQTRDPERAGEKLPFGMTAAMKADRTDDS